VTTVFFEAPHRIEALFGELTKVVGPDRIVGVGRELTKAHEEFVVCPISAAPGQLHSLKGEFVLVLGPASPSDMREAPPSAEELRLELGRMTDNVAGGSRRAALKQLGQRYGISVNELYKLLGD
jgi:16S rRNA (cytidine1402-2'-O)-methyltransferase